MADPLPTFTNEELERYWGELDKLNRAEAKARLDYALLVRRAMIELSELLACPVEKIHSRVEELVKENEYLRHKYGVKPVDNIPVHDIGDRLWWVNYEYKAIQVEVVDNTSYGYTIKDIDTGEFFYYIKHKTLLHSEIFSMVSAKVDRTNFR